MNDRKLKINYLNEYYISPLVSLIICIVALLLIFVTGFSNGMIKAIFDGDISIILFLLIALGPMIIVMYFLFRSYKKTKRQRNMNLYIINNGICVDGKVISIRHTYTSGPDIGDRGIHNTIADIEFTYNGIKQVLVEDNLLISEKNIKKYQNKKVKVYIYNNMYYIDIIN